MSAALVMAVQICLQPLDPVDPAVVRVAARGIEHVYGFGHGRPLSDSASW